MVKKSVVDYLKSQLQKGYDISTIRNVMLRYGYTNQDIDEAVKELYHPTIRHEIHFSATAVIVILVVCTSALAGSYFIFRTPKGPEQLLDLSLEPVKTTAFPGGEIRFIKSLSNLGSSIRYDVTIKQEILDTKTYNPITEKTETRAIETFGSTTTSIIIPAETKPGNYLLRAIVEYGDKKAVATLPVKVLSTSNLPSCFDGIKNQNEEDVDCGGVCSSCETSRLDCDDKNPCTNDIAENGKCISTPIVPCCGNGICEENEKGTCNDCHNDNSGPQPVATIDEIRETAKTNPEKAMQQCSAIDIADLKDTCITKIGEVQRNKNYCLQINSPKIKDICYSNIANALNDNLICQAILNNGTKDACYMNFMLGNKDFSLCDMLANKQLRQQCEYLKQAKAVTLGSNQNVSATE